MASRTPAKKAAAAPSDADPAVSPADVDPTPDVEATASQTEAGGHTYVLEYDGVDDGPVTFSRGDESETFDVSGGRITTTKERAEWLLRYTAARPVAEKE